MIMYPFLIVFITGFIIPAILERTTDTSSAASMNTLLIGFVITLSMGGFVMGAMLGFSLLENKDENTLTNIAVSPVTVSGYATFKVVYTTIMSFFANMFMPEDSTGCRRQILDYNRHNNDTTALHHQFRKNGRLLVRCQSCGPNDRHGHRSRHKKQG